MLFRSYLFLVAGLLIAAVLLDLGFRYLQSTESRDADPWLASGLRLIEGELAAAAADERAEVLERLRQSSGLDIRLLPREDVAAHTDTAENSDTPVDAGGLRYPRRRGR